MERRRTVLGLTRADAAWARLEREPQGDDKPLEYPHMFRAATLMIINKVDLAPYVEFDIEAAIAGARLVNPAIEVIALSVKTGVGMDAWYGWLRTRAERVA